MIEVGSLWLGKDGSEKEITCPYCGALILEKDCIYIPMWCVECDRQIEVNVPSAQNSALGLDVLGVIKELQVRRICFATSRHREKFLIQLIHMMQDLKGETAHVAKQEADHRIKNALMAAVDEGNSKAFFDRYISSERSRR